MPVRIAYDAPSETGPVNALLAALRVTWTELAVIVGGDQPDLSQRVLLEMVRAARDESNAEAVVLREAGRAFALPCVVRVVPLRARAIDLIRPSAGPVPGLAALFIDAPGRAIADEDWKEHDPFGLTLRDIDRPDELRL